MDDAVNPKSPTQHGAEVAPRFECDTLEALQRQLRQLLDANASAFVPPLVAGTFIIRSNAIISTTRAVITSESSPPAVSPHDDDARGTARGRPSRDVPRVQEDVAVAKLLTVDATQSVDLTQYQRLVVRTVVAAIGQTDGFGYTARNEWPSKSNGRRFRYACKDSLQNKDRKANGNRKEKKNNEIEPPKSRSANSPFQTYDCGGSITITFCVEPPRLEVDYGHAAIHRSEALRRISSRTARQDRYREQIVASASDTHDGLSRENNGPSRVYQTPLAVPEVKSDEASSGGSTAVDSVQSKPHNPFMTANGTPKQEGVFEHRPGEPQSTIVKRERKPREAKPSPSPGTKRRRVVTSRSRTGCMTCKLRRTKCDETHPVCRNCANTQRQCSYTKPNGQSPSSSPGLIHSPSVASKSVASNPGPGDGYNWQHMNTETNPGPEVYAESGASTSMSVDEHLLRLLNQPELP